MIMRLANKVLFSATLCVALLAIFSLARGPLAAFFFQRGLQQKAGWRLESATRSLNWAFRLEPGNAEARFQKGICHQLRGDILASQRELDPLMTMGTEDTRFRARLLNSVGVNLFNSNEPDAAMDLHRQSLSLAEQLGDGRLQAAALIDLSRVLYFSKGQTDEALRHLEAALELSRQSGDELLQADALRNLGVVYWLKGELDRPLGQFYQPALEIYRRLNDVRDAAVTLSDIGLIHFDEGDMFQFRKYQDESLELKERIGDMIGLCDSYSYIGGMYGVIGNLRKASDYYIRSLQIGRQTGYRLGEKEAEARLTAVYKKLGDYDRGISICQRLIEQDSGSPTQVRNLLSGLAYFYQLKGDLGSAREYYQQAIEMDRSTGPSEWQALLLNQLGHLCIVAGDLERATEYLDKAEQLAMKEKQHPWWIRLDNRMAWSELLEHQGRRAGALNQLMIAAEIESNTFGSTDGGLLQGEHRPLYDRLFSFLLERSEADRPALGNVSLANAKLAFRYLETLKYRSFRNLVVQLREEKATRSGAQEKEKQVIAEIERASEKLKLESGPETMETLRRAYGGYEDSVVRSELSGSRYEQIRKARAAELEEVQSSLEQGTALVEYLFAGQKVFALVVTRSSLRAVALPVTVPNLAAKVKLLSALIFGSEGLPDTEGDRPWSASQPETQSDDTAWQRVAEDLRFRLIEPLEQSGSLSGIKRLGLVPFGFLHDLPFAALVRSEKGQMWFLVQDYTIFYAPAASFLRSPASRAPSVEEPMLAFGRNEGDDIGSGPLRFAEEEARVAAKIMGGEVRVNDGATETELKRLAPRFRVIHLATHGLSEPMMPLLSRLTLQSTPEDDGNLTVREILALGLRADLVTLAGCRTAKSSSASGNETSDVDRIGLIEAFLHAGARSVLASLPPVDDRSSLEFMSSFYENLRSKDKAEALAETQRAMLKGELCYTTNSQPHRLSHPRHWAPFVIVGDPR